MAKKVSILKKTTSFVPSFARLGGKKNHECKGEFWNLRVTFQVGPDLKGGNGRTLIRKVFFSSTFQV